MSNTGHGLSWKVRLKIVSILIENCFYINYYIENCFYRFLILVYFWIQTLYLINPQSALNSHLIFILEWLKSMYDRWSFCFQVANEQHKEVFKVSIWSKLLLTHYFNLNLHLRPLIKRIFHFIYQVFHIIMFINIHWF